MACGSDAEKAVAAAADGVVIACWSRLWAVLLLLFPVPSLHPATQTGSHAFAGRRLNGATLQGPAVSTKSSEC